ncbi:family 4 glycosyl hydrolase [Phytohabitans houttuyneae]|uniref:6-phospho-beta-glucosidase n=1 Tax=Phytohabitans houttuyneae TaxID=1076126 RepID=A0A6V8KQA1_9ACTN|nr:6-phospho-beta-glucosidase [Phytohabitans houttuyneae]GFJ84036.1 6-phospho-beta-glucosidase [Phytohabitans houttuyneae]
MKIAVVGGGSTYTPELVEGFARLLPGADLHLLDPAADRLAVVGPFARRLNPRVTWTTDPDEGLDGADIVVIQLRVGGQQARIHDETFPLACGCVGQETTGAGGLAKAVRTVPVVLDIAERAARRAAPGAWIVNFTNPVGIVTRALLDAGHPAVGLCNVAIGFQRRFAELLGVPPDAVDLDHVGLNHLTWERAARVDGVDRLPALLSEFGDDLAAQVGLPPQVLSALGSVPSYYLRYFYAHDQVVREERGRPTRAHEVARIEAELLRLYADPALSEKPPLLAQRGGAYYSEAAVGLVNSLTLDDGAHHAANVRNSGTLPFLPDEAVIEVTCEVGASGATPRPVAPVGPALSGLIAAVAAYEELAVAAAVHGGRSRVYSALLAHPLVGQHERAEALAGEVLA